jgi:hypothetical protein
VHDEAAASAGTAPAPLATARPSPASNAAPATVIAARDLFSNSLIVGTSMKSEQPVG